jgi:hypothetical protein
MRHLLSRGLLAIAAAIALLGAYLHARAFAAKMSTLIAGSDLSEMMRHELQALWLCDSSTLTVVGIAFLWQMRSPSLAATALWAALPAATATLIYCYVGPFFAAHLLMVGALLALMGAYLGEVKRA